MMNTELEGVLELLFLAGLEDLFGKLDLDRERVGVRVLEGGILDLERDREDVGVLVRDWVICLVRVGTRDLDGVADGHRNVPVLPGPTKRVQDPRIGPETVPARHLFVSRHQPQN